MKLFPSSRFASVLGGLALALGATGTARADSPAITGISLVGGRPVLQFEPLPAAVEYQVFRADSLTAPFTELPGGTFGLFQWQGPALTGDLGFFRVAARTLSADQIAVANLLERVTYGPTPDELDRVRQLGADAYLAEQVAAETIAEDLDTPPPFTPEWRQVIVSGTATSSRIYLYLDGPGDAYVDDVRLVTGTGDDGTRPNLVVNGGFETALTGAWTLTENFAGTVRSAEFVRSGNASLRLVATAAGSGADNAMFQNFLPALAQGQPYTISFWYLTAPQNRTLTVRLSGGGVLAEQPLSALGYSPSAIYPSLLDGTAEIEDLRAWHVLRAIQSQRQLHEVLRQFLENHFVTEYAKTRVYFDEEQDYPDEIAPQPATAAEFEENRRWAAALLNPQVTFYDLLKISAESPAMIIYLDTVDSRGDRRSNGEYRIANENYARELCELFCFGVDNGYDQQDIVQISRIWTGWTTEFLAPADQANPFASRSTVLRDASVVTNRNDITNLVGAWSLKYRPTRHDPRPKYPFFQRLADGNVDTNRMKTVPARFGAPWAGRPYGLVLPGGNDTNSLQEGYAILRHMADQPFTQEFISVKLCQLFVHDDFHPGYDYADAARTPEEDLVRACMLAWENPPGGGPKGQLRAVLRTIFNSALFRSHLASQQKVKTPLEFAVSAVRALRARQPDGSFTANSDGYGLYNLMNRAGRMRLFDRAEPNGYPEAGPGWISAGTLSERLRFIQSAVGVPDNRAGDAGANTTADPVALLRLKHPEALRDAAGVAGYFVDLLFPAEGPANLAEFRTLAVEYLNTADNDANLADGLAASPFANLTPGTAAYDTRVRGLVAFLMCTQRFQEQ
jgi:uncharacterized protein (DUF1800 family)